MNGRIWILCLIALALAPTTCLAQVPTQPQTAQPSAVTDSQHKDIRVLAKEKISLSVEDTDLKDFVQAVMHASPDLMTIEVRTPATVRVSLKVTEIPMEDLLSGYAGLVHCHLYVLPGRFLIAPPNQISDAEKAQVIVAENPVSPPQK